MRNSHIVGEVQLPGIDLWGNLAFFLGIYDQEYEHMPSLYVWRAYHFSKQGCIWTPPVILWPYLFAILRARKMESGSCSKRGLA